MSLSVLVVGGAGYVGSHTVKLLIGKGHDVTVFDNLSRGHRDAAQSAELVVGDLLDNTSLQKTFQLRPFDAVMHFAALCYVGESVDKPREYYRNNVTGSLNLLDAMLQAGIRELVFSSTCSTYGDPAEIPITESHPQNPINPYGASKLMIERVLKDYADAFGLNSVALRYFNAAGSDSEGILGERHEPETHLIPLVLKEALRIRKGGAPEDTSLIVHGTDYGTPDGTCVRDYVHVSDLASAHIAAVERMLDRSISGAKSYNLGSDRGFSVLDVIQSGRRVTGLPIQFKIGSRRSGDPPFLVADSNAARRDLAWRPGYQQLDAIVATAWQWFSTR